jgi:hypothetical protein
MAIRNGLAGAVGNTPLIRLDGLSRETGCEILGKAEFLNPGGSVKDRAALYIIQDADRPPKRQPVRETGATPTQICNNAAPQESMERKCSTCGIDFVVASETLVD